MHKSCEEFDDWDGTFDWATMKSDSNASNISIEGELMVAGLMYQNSEGLHSDYFYDGTSVNYDDNVPFMLIVI